jgi:sec-independent protein translocase protein TatB
MFEVGFSELVLVAVVALIVIGPERLPKVARTAGLWMGRARRTLGAVKQEIDRELKAVELGEILKQQALSQSVETILEVTTAVPDSNPVAAAPAAVTAPADTDAAR